MQSGGVRRVSSAAKERVVRLVLAFAAAALLAGCQTNGSPTASLGGAHGPSVAFESIDGPPPDVFRKLVAELNTEAQSRRLAVVSRESPSAYRVRGYLAATVEGGRTAIAWTWDVYNADQHRAFRITGAQTRPGKRKPAEAWSVADDDMLKKIAASSLDQLSGFLAAAGPQEPTQPEAAQAAAQADGFTPEDAGIFRIFQVNADPVPTSETPDAAAAIDGAAVPLPPRRPAPPHERVAAMDVPRH